MNWIPADKALSSIENALHTSSFESQKILADLVRSGVLPAIGRFPIRSGPNMLFPDGYFGDLVPLVINSADHIEFRDGNIIQNGIAISEPHFDGASLASGVSSKQIQALSTKLAAVSATQAVAARSARRKNSGRPIQYDWALIEAEMNAEMTKGHTTFKELYNHTIERLRTKPGLKGQQFPHPSTVQKRLYPKFKSALDEANR